eukprot:superscaffoldBa00000521_g5381
MVSLSLFPSARSYQPGSSGMKLEVVMENLQQQQAARLALKEKLRQTEMLYTISLGAIISSHGFPYHCYADDTQLFLLFPPEDLTVSSLHTEKESWQQKVSQLEELLSDKEREISRANKKRRARTIAHIDTLALLNETQSALKQSQLACDSLEEQLRQRLTEKEEKDQRELSERVESLQKELSETASKAREELSTVCGSWERRSQQWEEMLRAKDEIWIHEEAQRKEEIRCLTDDNLQLQ